METFSCRRASIQIEKTRLGKAVVNKPLEAQKREFLAWRYEYEERKTILLVLPTHALAGDFWLRAGERWRNYNCGEEGRRSYSATTARFQQPPGVPQRHRRGCRSSRAVARLGRESPA